MVDLEVLLAYVCKTGKLFGHIAIVIVFICPIVLTGNNLCHEKHL